MLRKTVLVMLTALLIFVVPVSAQEEVMELDEVVVTASRYQESIMETPVSIEVIDQEEIEESNARNLADLLAGTGGIHIKNSGGAPANQDIIIRGMRGKRILVLLDGQKYNNPQDGSINLDFIDLNIIKRIEILKSPASAVYGANAMGGVINIITKEAKNDEFGLKLSYGSYNHKKLSLSKSFVGKKYNFLINYSKLDSEGHRNNIAQQKDSLFLKYQYNLSTNKNLIFNYKYNDNQIDYPGADPEFTDAVFLAQAGSLENSDQNFKFLYQEELDNLSREVSLFNNRQQMLDLSYNAETNIEKWGINAQQTHFLNKHTLSYGVEIEAEQVDYDDLYDEDNVNKAVYIQDKYAINKVIEVNFGLRYDKHQKYGSEISPELALNYSLNNNLNLVAAAGKSFRPPTYMDLYYPGFSNPDLKPEKSDSYEIGLKYNDQSCSRQITFYKREIEDMISPDPLSYLPENIDSALINGVEFSAQRKIKDFQLEFNYNYLDAENESTGKQIGDMPYHKYNVNLSYQINEANKIILENSYTGERMDYISEADMGAYFVSDLTYIRNLNDKTSLSVEINNLFDKEYEVVDGYPMPGRNFMVNLSTNF
ncbi:TonB-dependent siderophore receptor [Halanaerobium sp.]|uniref:TonB-dependent receptor plug domain-containing protein n=1 Tax=Halanaerobium sp. TaxID=1895664 RepID=UPI000DE74D56|nr:TonB-dependent receptor [Halanaerobium sp.]PUU94634.1 MAG: iron complex outermembrane recepter protein [Halanaerobium sp.]